MQFVKKYPNFSAKMRFRSLVHLFILIVQANSTPVAKPKTSEHDENLQHIEVHFPKKFTNLQDIFDYLIQTKQDLPLVNPNNDRFSHGDLNLIKRRYLPSWWAAALGRPRKNSRSKNFELSKRSLLEPYDALAASGHHRSDLQKFISPFHQDSHLQQLSLEPFSHFDPTVSDWEHLYFDDKFKKKRAFGYNFNYSKLYHNHDYSKYPELDDEYDY